MERLRIKGYDYRVSTPKKKLKSSKTEYKYVYLMTIDSDRQKDYYQARIPKSMNAGYGWTKAMPVTDENLHTLAKMVDVKLIKAGRKPVNVLKPH